MTSFERGPHHKPTRTVLAQLLAIVPYAQSEHPVVSYQAKRGSTSLLQRHLRVGYGRAAAILDAMVREGYIGEMDGSTRARPILEKAYEYLQDLSEMENEQ